MKKKSQNHVMVISDLLNAEDAVNDALKSSMEVAIKRCPKQFQKTIMMEYRESMSLAIGGLFKNMIDKTDLFIPTKSEAEARVLLFNSRFGSSMVKNSTFGAHEKK